jgi:hypothetical protein
MSSRCHCSITVLLHAHALFIPVTGYSLESYRMVFVDQSSYDGQSNLQMISKKGREYLRWCVAGSVVPRGFDANTSRASDVDGASVHMLKTAGCITS